MKKKIFIAIHYMEIGGAESALIGLLHSFDYDRYEVDLFMANHQGELLPYIPKQVHILPELKEYASLAIPLKQVFSNGSVCIGVARLWSKLQCRFHKWKEHIEDSTSIFAYIAHNTKRFLPMMSNKEYDAAICFLFHKEIFIEKVRAKKYIAWIHTDWSSVDTNVSLDLPAWGRYDTIVSISDDVTRTFIKRFPSLESKITVIENILPSVLIAEKSKLIMEEDVRREMPKMNGGYNILSIGRFSEAKNYDNVPNICKIINEKHNLNVKWYIIGWGGDEDLIRQKIAEEKMEDFVIILGKKTNPYPYILACDVYAQPSRYEGKSVTVREAQCLRKPVVVSAYPTAPSQIKNGVDGIIAPMDNAGYAEGMANFIRDADLQHRIVDYLSDNDYANAGEVNKLYDLIP